LRVGAIRSDSGYPSLEVRVEGKAKGFSGGSEAWIDGFALKEFTAALRAFERSRQGRVELHSMTAGELQLVLRAVGEAGHPLLEFTISRTVPVGDGPEPVTMRVSGAFALDPGALGELVAGFAQLANAVAT
jgi:hypothetical protein